MYRKFIVFTILSIFVSPLVSQASVNPVLYVHCKNSGHQYLNSQTRLKIIKKDKDVFELKVIPWRTSSESVGKSLNDVVGFDTDECTIRAEDY